MSRIVRGDVARLYAGLIAANVVAWAWAFGAFGGDAALLGTALLAYTLGLRHAVDADHIAAIDNVTRKLMRQGRRPLTVGLFFSLGHSTVVILASVAIAATASALQGEFETARRVGGLVGTLVSAGFLFGIGAINLVVLRGVWAAFRRARAGGEYAEDDLDALLAGRGLLARLFRPAFRLVRAPWQMYPLGFLFGLGFDTATEVAVLGLSAAGAARGMPVWSIMVFPALFTAGMTLIDTTDSVLMVGAYGWAFAQPIRTLYYNLTITGLSAAVALIVGAIETLGLAVDHFGLSGGVWDAVTGLNEHFGMLGLGIVVLFAAGWAGSMIVYRARGYDRIEIREASPG